MTDVVMHASYAVRCEYTLIRRKARTGREVERVGPFRNLIVSQGLDALLASGSGGNFAVSVGSGNTPPTMANTTIQSFIAATTTALGAPTNEFQTVNAPIYYRKRFGGRFGEGVAAGNVAEVAWLLHVSGTPNASTPIFSRALVRDANGEPTVITVLSDEFLDVIIDYYIYPQAEATGVVNLFIDGVSTPHSYIVRPSSMSGSTWGNADSSTSPSGPTPIMGYGGPSLSITRAYNGNIGSPTGDPAGAVSGNLNAPALGGYVAGSHTREFTVQMGLAQANLSGGIRTMRIDLRQARMQCQYDPPIAKIATKTLNLTYRVTVANG